LYDLVALFRSVGSYLQGRRERVRPPGKKKKITQVPSTRQIVRSYIYTTEKERHICNIVGPPVPVNWYRHSRPLVGTAYQWDRNAHVLSVPIRPTRMVSSNVAERWVSGFYVRDAFGNITFSRGRFEVI